MRRPDQRFLVILVWLKTFFRHDEHNVSMALAYLSA